MDLTLEEKNFLNFLINKEYNQWEGAFWSIVLDDPALSLKNEACRLVEEAKIAKEAEVAAWPSMAQQKYTTLQGELNKLQVLENKLKGE